MPPQTIQEFQRKLKQMAEERGIMSDERLAQVMPQDDPWASWTPEDSADVKSMFSENPPIVRDTQGNPHAAYAEAAAEDDAYIASLGMDKSTASDFHDFVSEPLGARKGSSQDYWEKYAQTKNPAAAIEETARQSALSRVTKRIGTVGSESALEGLLSGAGRLSSIALRGAGILGTAYGLKHGYDISKEGGPWAARLGKTVEDLMGYPAGTSGRPPTQAETDKENTI